MELKYNITGADRKRLVKAIGEFLECAPSYKGAPSFAYEVDYFTIDKNGTVSFDDSADPDNVEPLVEALLAKGFEPEIKDATFLCIEFPRAVMTDAAFENLRRLVDSKAALIKKALDADRLEIELTDDMIRFPWFDNTPEAEVVSAATHLIEKLVGMAKTQKRVTAKEKETGNNKYAFRCFLLRLGFIGSEYKEQRKILLHNLNGSSAFKGGSKDE